MSSASASLPTPGYVSAVEAGSFALQAGVRSGDALLAVNGHAVQDVVDVLFYGASPRLNLTVLRAGRWACSLRKPPSTLTSGAATTCARFVLCCRHPTACAARST